MSVKRGEVILDDGDDGVAHIVRPFPAVREQPRLAVKPWARGLILGLLLGIALGIALGAGIALGVIDRYLERLERKLEPTERTIEHGIQR